MSPGVRISVLTPAFNASEHIEELIESVASQTYPAFEHIIIDDGSTDGTFEIVRRYDFVSAVRRENRGQYATQNELLGRATGDVIVLVSADDLFGNRDALSMVAAIFAGDLSIDVVVGRTPRQVEGPLPYTAHPDVPLWLGCRTVSSCLAIKHCSVFVRRALVLTHGVYFDESYRMAGDWEWLVRVMRLARRVQTVGADLGTWRIHPGQTSRRAIDVGLVEKRRVLAESGGSLRTHLWLKRTFDLYSRAEIFWAVLRRYGWRIACRRLAAFLVYSVRLFSPHG